MFGFFCLKRKKKKKKKRKKENLAFYLCMPMYPLFFGMGETFRNSNTASLRTFNQQQFVSRKKRSHPNKDLLPIGQV